jgi:hypothetical protein
MADAEPHYRHCNQWEECGLDTASKRVSTNEALRRLAQKQVPPPAYKGPRGNQETDKKAMDYERARLEAILA